MWFSQTPALFISSCKSNSQVLALFKLFGSFVLIKSVSEKPVAEDVEK